MKHHRVLLIILVIETIAFTALDTKPFRWQGDLPSYASQYTAYLGEYATNLIGQAGPILFLAFGMTLVLMTAGIDLSVASMTALIACVMSLFEGDSQFWWQAIPVAACLAVALGGFNGLLVSRLNMPPIIATLGTMILFRGLCSVAVGDRELAPFLGVPGYEWCGSFQGVLVIGGLLYGGGGFWFGHSRIRRELRMIGGGPVAARYAAIRVERGELLVYVLSGAMAFLAAVAFTARNGSVSGSVLQGVELQVIVAVVLGGTRVEGGNGTLGGTLLGVLIIAVLEEGLRGAALWGSNALPFDMDHLRYLLLGGLLVLGVRLNARHAP